MYVGTTTAFLPQLASMRILEELKILHEVFNIGEPLFRQFIPFTFFLAEALEKNDPTGTFSGKRATITRC
jgi:hypothetical protein